ncbi:hypothetical protein HPB47_016300 [Ixodes persulcatus]|uniref:Uncharacterized protein n=1 Tax=Ixodes persulcatus TaxID=34615 RepID=A0AC60QR93_IXOPE|nr:hypothetical protein HPB47_016300 [Ixodes persulcatus]
MSPKLDLTEAAFPVSADRRGDVRQQETLECGLDIVTSHLGNVGFKTSPESYAVLSTKLEGDVGICSRMNRSLDGNKIEPAPFVKILGLHFDEDSSGGSDISLGEGVENESFLEQNTTGQVWTAEQQNLVQSLGGRSLRLAGDGRSDSPGYSALYGTYSLLETSLNRIIHLELVKSTEVKSSCQMELEGLTRALLHLEERGLTVEVIVTDRHVQVSAYMKRQHPLVQHRFDLWHDTRLREAGAKVVCCLTRGAPKGPNLPLDRLNHQDALFPGHGKATHSQTWVGLSHFLLRVVVSPMWLGSVGTLLTKHLAPKVQAPPAGLGVRGDATLQTPAFTGTETFKTLESVVLSSHLLRDIPKLSSDEQTFALEAFHGVLVHLASKSVGYCYEGLQARTYIAALHFNCNADRKTRIEEDGQDMCALKFSRGRKQWTVVPVKEDTKFAAEYLLLAEVAPVAELRETRLRGFRGCRSGLRQRRVAALAWTAKVDCTAYVKCKSSKEMQKLVVVDVCLQHTGHEVSEAVYRHYPQNRHLTAEEEQLVQEPVTELQVNPSLLRNFLQSKTWKPLTAKDIENVVARLKGNKKPDIEQLGEEIKELFRQDPTAAVTLGTNDSNEMELLLIQTSMMAEFYKKFPEVLLLDGIYRTNNLKMALFVFMVVDGNGSSQVVAYCFVSSEDRAHMDSMMQIFVGLQEADKDFKEIRAIRDNFSSDAVVQLCEFHVKKALKRAGTSSKDDADKDRLNSLLVKMIHAANEEAYDILKAELDQTASEGFKPYFEKNWPKMQDMWVRYRCDQHFNLGNNTTNRVECHNSKLKAVLKVSDKIHVALKSMLKLHSIKIVESEHLHALNASSSFFTYKSNTDLIQQCSSLLTPFATGKVVCEEQKANIMPEASVSDFNEDYAVTTQRGHYVVSYSLTSCTCRTFATMGVVCRHMILVSWQTRRDIDVEEQVQQLTMRWTV